MSGALVSLLVYDHPTLARTRSGDTHTPGTTIGRVVLTEESPDGLAVRHETIHLIQAVQTSTVTPHGTLGSLWLGGRRVSSGGTVQWDLRADWLYAVLGGLSVLLADGPEDGWAEAEAYELDSPPGGGSSPTPCLPRPPGVACNLRSR